MSGEFEDALGRAINLATEAEEDLWLRANEIDRQDFTDTAARICIAASSRNATVRRRIAGAVMLALRVGFAAGRHRGMPS